MSAYYLMRGDAMNDLQNNDIKANAQAGAVNISTNDVSFQPTVNLGINGGL